MEDNNNFIVSNVWFFYRIAKDSHESMKTHFESGRRPRTDGEPGEIIKYDPEHKSFKAALVTVVFCGIYLEALLHHLIVRKKGLKVYDDYDYKTYKTKLKLLDCHEQSILDDCEHYKAVRKEIVHEKAYKDTETIRYAQNEATRAFKMIEAINKHFEINNN